MFSYLFRYQKDKFYLGAIVFIWMFWISFTLHGYSLPVWSRILNVPSPMSIGSSRAIRSDDYVAFLPLAFSQIKNNFKEENEFISFGQIQTFSTYPSPVKDWTSFFRLETWGFYFGPNLGMSWSWSLKVFGTFFVLMILLRRLIPDASVCLIFCTSFFIFYSPGFQYWSLNPVPSFLFAISASLAISKSLISKQLLPKVFFAFLFILFSFSFVFNVYPPLQIISCYFAIICFFLLTPLELIKKRANILLLILSIVALVVMFLSYLVENKEVIEIILNTSYPGKRSFTGGNGSIISLFKNNLLSSRSLPPKEIFGWNVSEAASFINISPLFFFLFLCRLKKACLHEVIFFFFSLFFLIWYFSGFPDWLAQISGFAFIPEGRGIFILPFLNLFTVIYISNKKLAVPPYLIAVFFILWAIIHLYPAYCIFEHDHNLLFRIIPHFLIISLGCFFLLQNKVLSGVIILAVLSGFQSFSFNPIVVGGYEKIFENKEVLILKNIIKNKSVIVDEDIVLSNLPRILGLNSYSGVHFYPQHQFWKVLDPQKRFYKEWNRYAHIIWKLDKSVRKIEINNPQADVVNIRVSPNDSVLDILGVDYILTKNNTIKDLGKSVKLIKKTSCCFLFQIDR